MKNPALVSKNKAVMLLTLLVQVGALVVGQPEGTKTVDIHVTRAALAAIVVYSTAGT